MHYYCPSCPAKITYEATKPTKCPKCNTVFATAFKDTPVAPVPQRAAAQYDDDLDAPQPRRRPVQSTTVAKPRYRNGQWVAPVQGRLNDEPVAPALPPDEDGVDDEDYIDPRSKARLKRELLAGLNPDDIHVNDEDERPTTFGDLWNADAARKARDGGGQ